MEGPMSEGMLGADTPGDNPDEYEVIEGDCPSCDGTGEVPCPCGGDCPECLDGMRPCARCDGSGFMPVGSVGPNEDDF
jgi:hypothetical protein